MKAKKIICIILIILGSVLLINSIFNFLESLIYTEYEIIVTNKNRTEINKMIEKFYDEPNKINRIKLKELLGEGELRLYNYIYLEKETIVGDGDEITKYIWENGTSANSIYLIEILIETIILLYIKSVLDVKSE